MPICPRCAHQCDDGMRICTCCGSSLHPARPAGEGISFPLRVALWLIPGVLAAVLILLVLMYLNSVGNPAP